MRRAWLEAGAAGIAIWAWLGVSAGLSAQTTSSAVPSGQSAGTLGNVPQGLNTPGVQVSSQAAQAGGETLDTPAVGEARDSSAQASPVSPERKRQTLAQGMRIEVQLNETVSSGAQRNGDAVQGILTGPLRTSSGTVLTKGTPVQATVVSSAKAGTISSGGVLSLQLTRIGSLGVVSDVREFAGKEGHKDVADSAPDKGEEASVKAGTRLQFSLLENGSATGLMPGAEAAGATGSDRGAQQMPTGTPNTRPGVNQRPVGGATQGVVPHPQSR